MMLLLDLDDTLADAQQAFESRMRAWLTQFPSDLRELMADFLMGDEDRGLDPLACFDRFRKQFGLSQPADRLVREFVSRLPEHYQLLPGTAPTLKRLRLQGWSLGVVTNGPAALQRGKVEWLALEELVDTVVISGEESVAKPDPEIFALAVKRLGGEAESGWMIGDNPVADIGGARQAGLRSIWLRRGRRWDHAHGPVDLQADTLTEALALLPALDGREAVDHFLCGPD